MCLTDELKWKIKAVKLLKSKSLTQSLESDIPISFMALDGVNASRPNR